VAIGFVLPRRFPRRIRRNSLPAPHLPIRSLGPDWVRFARFARRPTLLWARRARPSRNWLRFAHLALLGKLGLFCRCPLHVQFNITPFPRSTCPSRRLRRIGFVSHDSTALAACPGANWVRFARSARAGPSRQAAGQASRCNSVLNPQSTIRNPQSRHRLGAPLRAIGFVSHASHVTLQTSNPAANWLCFARLLAPRHGRAQRIFPLQPRPH
jgi:hypothetical protein